MGKFLKAIYVYAAMPVTLLSYWYTQHPAFLYLMGVLSTITLLVALLGLAGVVVMFVDQDFTTEVPPFPAWKLAVGYVYQLTAITYLLYVRAFVVSTIYIISLVAVNVLIVGLKAYTKRRDKELALR